MRSKKVPDTFSLAVWVALRGHYFLADGISEEIARIEDTIEDLTKGELCERLMSYPAVGPVMAATWIAEIEPAKRFQTDRHAVAYCGLDPTPMISGGRQVGSKLRLGNTGLCVALIQAGSLLLNGRSALGLKFKHRPGSFKLRSAIAARHLCRLLYRCSVQGESYDEAKVTRNATDGAERPDPSWHSAEALA